MHRSKENRNSDYSSISSDYDREKDRRRRRSRSRSDSRDRKKSNRDEFKGRNFSDHRNNGGDSYGGGFGPKSTTTADSSTIVIKGLPSHTTEPTLYAVLAIYCPKDIRLMTQRDGECKGFAFVEFVSLEHAQYFMATFAGSSGGNPNAPQFIVDNRAVALEYAREKDAAVGGAYRGHAGERKHQPRADWLCAMCNCHNFAKRDACFRCSAQRTDACVAVQSGADTSSDSTIGGDSPSRYLAVRGFGLHVTDAQVAELFRQFAAVKSAVLMKDPGSNYSRGLAYVEFHTLEHAVYAQQSSSGLQMDSLPLKVSFARENVMNQLVQQLMQPGSLLAIAPPSAAYHGAEAQQWPTNSPYGADLMSQQHYAQLTASQFAQQQQLQQQAMMQQFAASAAPPRFQYPLNFDTHGAGYVFQPRSGCFLEPLSEYYYCPRSKLYYNARDGAYLRFDPSSELAEEGFVRFVPPMPLEPEAESFVVATTAAEPIAAAVVVSGEVSSALDKSSRNPVSLSMGLSGLANKGKSKAVGIGRKLVQDIAKWEALQEEEEPEAVLLPKNKGKTAEDVAGMARKSASGGSFVSIEPSAPSNESQHTQIQSLLTNAEMALLSQQTKRPTATGASTSTDPMSSSTSTNTAAKQTPVTSTTSSSVCLLCKRQFPSPEMLLRHERESKLHADNLKAAAAGAGAPKDTQEAAVAPAPAPPVYRNRALERRLEDRHTDALTATQLRNSVLGHEVEEVHEATHGKPNYSSSDSKVSGFTAPPPVAAVPVFSDVSNPGNALLRKMGWSEGQGLGKDNSGKEEAVGVELAQSRSAAVGGGSSFKMEGSNYKESLLLATRARFEQISKR